MRTSEIKTNYHIVKTIIVSICIFLYTQECTASVGVKRNPQLSFSDFIDDGVVLCE